MASYDAKLRAAEERLEGLTAKREGATGARRAQLDRKLADTKGLMDRIRAKQAGQAPKAPTKRGGGQGRGRRS